MSGGWRMAKKNLTDSQESGSSDEIPPSPEPSMGKFRNRVRQTPGQRMFPIFNMGKTARDMDEGDSPGDIERLSSSFGNFPSNDNMDEWECFVNLHQVCNDHCCDGE